MHRDHRLETFALVLRLIKKHRPMRATLHFKKPKGCRISWLTSTISYRDLKPIIKHLEKGNLIRKEDNGSYNLTQKGKEFLELYEYLVSFLKLNDARRLTYAFR